MKSYQWCFLIAMGMLLQCNSPETKTRDFKAVYQVETGNPVRVLFTTYNTTLLADGKDETQLRISADRLLPAELQDFCIPRLLSGNRYIRLPEMTL